MLTRTKDDQQYAVVIGVVPDKGGSPRYKVKCFGKLARVGPWERICTFTQHVKALQISQGTYVLIGYNYQDSKRGAVLHVYSADEARKLASDVSGYDLPVDLVKHMVDHGVPSMENAILPTGQQQVITT